MNCSPTLTAEEFKQIHNGLCDLCSVIDRLEGVLSPEMLGRIVKAKEQIAIGLVGAYDQDDQAFTRNRLHYESVQEELGLSAEWSMHEVDDLNRPHPFESVTKVVYRSHWGTKPISVTIVGNTWASLYVAANACIRDSGDEHHIFIENFKQEGDVLVLSTGS